MSTEQDFYLPFYAIKSMWTSRKVSPLGKLSTCCDIPDHRKFVTFFGCSHTVMSGIVTRPVMLRAMHPKELFLLLSTMFCYLMLNCFVQRRTRFSLRDKQLFKIIEGRKTGLYIHFYYLPKYTSS